THHRDLVRRPGVGEVGTDRLGVHDDVRTSVRLPQDQADTRHGRIAVRVQQLRAVPDDPAVLLVDTGKEPRYVQEGDDRNIESVTHLDKARSFSRGLDVQDARQHLRLVGDDADHLTVQAGQRADDVPRPALVDLQVLAVVDDLLDDL